MGWPRSEEELVAVQEELATRQPPWWRLPAAGCLFGGCFVCFAGDGSGPGAEGDPGWAGAALTGAQRAVVAVDGTAGAPYEPGLLAMREGTLLEMAVRALPRRPDVLLVNATGRDHPRRAGLALHLGAVLEVPTVGVTNRTLVAGGDWPGPRRGEAAPLVLEDELVGWWLRTRGGARPVAVHAGWRTDADTARQVVMAATKRVRTPEPIRRARRAARAARSRSR